MVHVLPMCAIALAISYITQGEDGPRASPVLSWPPAAKMAWKDLDEQSTSWCMRVTTTVTLLPRNEQLRFIVTRLRVGDSALVRVRTHRGSSDDVQSEVVNCINRKYAFKCDFNAKTSKWVIKSITPGPLSSNPVLDEIAEGRRVWHPLTTLDYASLHDLYEHRGLKLESFEEQSDGVTIRFKNVARSGIHAVDRITTGSLMLDPKHHWVLRQAKVISEQGTGTATYSCTNSYEISQGFPQPKRTEFERVFVTGDSEYRTKSVSDYEMLNPNKIQETDFTLSAFGLPEPFGVEWEKPTPWWLYIGGGTIGLIALAALGYRLFGRRAA